MPPPSRTDTLSRLRGRADPAGSVYRDLRRLRFVGLSRREADAFRSAAGRLRRRRRRPPSSAADLRRFSRSKWSTRIVSPPGVIDGLSTRGSTP